jgi:hypothetical protein
MKTAMIAMLCGDMLKANDPEKVEVFAALIRLIEDGRIIAFYDDNDGQVKIQTISGG